MPTQHRGWTLRGAVAVVIPLALVGAVVWVQLWHGPTLLTLSAAHGIDTGDLLAIPFLVLAIAVARRSPVRRRSSGWALSVSAVTLGVLLLFSGKALLTSQGGPLVPGGGATLDGEITQTIADDAVAVDRWTNLALTYDGADERLYVNGRQVARQAADGRIETPDTPLWIGGNRPYGEHFAGLIDEVRAFDRALSPAEVRRDMDEPVGPAPGLVAAYGFDEGSGRTVADASGRLNAGTIEGGAAWARGRHGGALRFNGSSSVVRVPPSPSLSIRRAMTLSAWIRPKKPQADWRTIVQHEVDAYFLSASSFRMRRQGVADAVRVVAILVAAAWFAFVVAAGRAPRTAVRQRTWWLPVVLFALGSLADAASFPTGTLVGPLLVALWLAVTAGGRIERTSLWITAGVFVGLTLASLTNLGEIGDELVRFHGSAARSMALGALFVMAGILARSSNPVHA